MEVPVEEFQNLKIIAAKLEDPRTPINILQPVENRIAIPEFLDQIAAAQHDRIVFDAHWKDGDWSKGRCHRFSTCEQSGRCQVKRYYDVALVPKCEVVFGNWPSVQAIGMTISVWQRGDGVTEEVRYYILSEYLTGEQFVMAAPSRCQPAQTSSVQGQHQRKAITSRMESSLPRSGIVFLLIKIRAPSVDGP